jgi:hypothetical protein
MKLAPPDDADDDDNDDVDQDQSDDGGDYGAETAAAEAAEAEATLTGAPPKLPPTTIAPPTNFALQAFDQAVATLKQLVTKPAAQFVSTIHSARNLENVEDFIRAVADQVREGLAGGSEAA